MILVKIAPFHCFFALLLLLLGLFLLGLFALGLGRGLLTLLGGDWDLSRGSAKILQ